MVRLGARFRTLSTARRWGRPRHAAQLVIGRVAPLEKDWTELCNQGKFGTATFLARRVNLCRFLFATGAASGLPLDMHARRFGCSHGENRAADPPWVVVSCRTHLHPALRPFFRIASRRSAAPVKAGARHGAAYHAPCGPSSPLKTNKMRACLAALCHDALRHLVGVRQSAVGSQRAMPWSHRARAHPILSSRWGWRRHKMRPAIDRPGTSGARRRERHSPSPQRKGNRS